MFHLSFEFAIGTDRGKDSILEEGKAAENVLLARQIKLKDRAFQQFVRNVQDEIRKHVEHLKYTHPLELNDRDKERWSAYRTDDTTQVLLIFFDSLHHEILFEKNSNPRVNLTLRVDRVTGNKPVLTARKADEEFGELSGATLTVLIRQAVEALTKA